MTQVAVPKICQEFIESKKDIDILFGPTQIEDQRTLLVLDSSFNPPHLGHLNLINEAIKETAEKPLHVLLLLAINNADKVPKPALFDKRIEMMVELGKYLHSRGIDNSVGVTLHGKFVDKSEAIYRSNFFHGNISYLVGFDTIVRIFDPKYYVPSTPSKILNDFMMKTVFYCLSRKGTELEQVQLNYANDMSKGLFEPELPSSWGKKIHIISNDSKYAGISSSFVRDHIAAGGKVSQLTAVLPSVIIEYLESTSENIFV